MLMSLHEHQRHAKFFVTLSRENVWMPNSLEEIQLELRSSKAGFDELEIERYHLYDLENDEEHPQLFEDFIECIQSNTSLKKLKLNLKDGQDQVIDLGPDDFVSLYLSVGRISSLEELLIFDPLGSAELVAVASSIRRLKKLKRLYLNVKQNSTGIHGALQEISDALKNHPALSQIDFHTRKDCDRHLVLDAFVEACSAMPALETLTANCHYDGATLHTDSFAILLKSRTIQTLDIRGVIYIEPEERTVTLGTSIPCPLKSISMKVGQQEEEQNPEAEDRILELLANVLASPSCILEKLYLWTRTGSDFTPIARALNSNRSLKSLRMRSHLSGDALMSLLQARRLLSGLEKLYLGSQSSYTVDQGRALAQTISSNSALIEVHPGTLSSSNLPALSGAISRNPSLEFLRLDLVHRVDARGLASWSIPDDDMIPFFNSLSSNDRLKKLILPKKLFNPPSWSRLVHSLENGSGLEELVYKGDRRDFVGPRPPLVASVIDDLVTVNSRLRVLKLGLENERSNVHEMDRWLADWSTLSQRILNHKYLEVLEISGSSISEADSSALSNALSRNTTLKSLSLKNCQLDDAGATVMANSLLPNNQTLEVLELDDNPITGDSAVGAFAEALTENASLKVLQMERCRPNNGNKVCERVAKAFLDMLKDNMTLLWLAIDETGLDNFYQRKMYYLRLNHMKRKEMVRYLSEGAGRDVWIKALIETRKDLDCTSYLLKLNPGMFFGHSGSRKRKREETN